MNRIDQDIKDRTYARVYLLYGTEDYLMQFYKKRLQEALITPGSEMNMHVWKGDVFDPRQFTDLAQTLPFFAAFRLLVVEDSGLFKKGGQELAEFLPSVPETTVVLFVEKEVDARSVLYKYIQKNGAVIKFEHLKEKELTTWILRHLGREGKQIQLSAMKLLLERTGDDMETILHELEKLVSYTGDSPYVMQEDVRAVVSDHTQNRIFELSDRLAGHDKAGALAFYYDLLADRQTPLGLLAMLGKHFERLLRIRELRDQGLDTTTIAQKMNMKPYPLRKSLGQAETFSAEALRHALKIMVKAEEDIKQGRMGDVLAVELVIMDISGT